MIALGPVIRAGAWQVAALEEQGVGARAIGGRIVAAGHKRPLALLLAGPDGLQAFRPDGRAMDRAGIEALLPGAWAAFAEAAQAAPAAPAGR